MREYPQDKPRTVVPVVDGASVAFWCPRCSVCAKWSARHNERPGEYILHVWLKLMLPIQVPVAYNIETRTWHALKINGEVEESEGGSVLYVLRPPLD